MLKFESRLNFHPTQPNSHSEIHSILQIGRGFHNKKNDRIK